MLMFPLIIASVLCDVGGQVCFKIGVHDDERAARRGVAGFFLNLARSRWIAVGIAIYALEFVVWFAALTVAPLSLAMPLAALSYCGIVVASRFILREHISARRWLGACVVAAGAAIVCFPTA